MPATLKRRSTLLQGSHVVYQAYSGLLPVLEGDAEPNDGINATGSTGIYHMIKETEVKRTGA